MRHYPIPIQGHFSRTVVLNEYKVANTTQGKSCNTYIPMQQTNKRTIKQITEAPIAPLKAISGDWMDLISL